MKFTIEKSGNRNEFDYDDNGYNREGYDRMGLYGPPSHLDEYDGYSDRNFDDFSPSRQAEGDGDVLYGPPPFEGEEEDEEEDTVYSDD